MTATPETVEAVCVAFIERLEKSGYQLDQAVFDVLADVAANAGYDLARIRLERRGDGT